MIVLATFGWSNRFREVCLRAEWIHKNLPNLDSTQKLHTNFFLSLLIRNLEEKSSEKFDNTVSFQALLKTFLGLLRLMFFWVVLASEIWNFDETAVRCEGKQKTNWIGLCYPFSWKNWFSSKHLLWKKTMITLDYIAIVIILADVLRNFLFLIIDKKLCEFRQ